MKFPLEKIVGVIIVGALITFFVTDFYAKWSIILTGKKTIGYITDLNSRYTPLYNHKIQFTETLDYYTENGTKYTKQAHFYHILEVFRPSKQRTIFYDSTNPNNFVVDNVLNYTSIIVLPIAIYVEGKLIYLIGKKIKII